MFFCFLFLQRSVASAFRLVSDKTLAISLEFSPSRIVYTVLFFFVFFFLQDSIKIK